MCLHGRLTQFEVAPNWVQSRRVLGVAVFRLVSNRLFQYHPNRFDHRAGMLPATFIPINVSELRWLESTVIRHGGTPFAKVHPAIRSRVVDTVERLAWTTEYAVIHELGNPVKDVRDDAMVAFAERVAVAVTSGRLKQQAVRVIWRLHSPRTWILRQVKVRASQGRKLPAHLPDACTLARPIPRSTMRNFGICIRDCDAAFYRQVLELSLAELGMLLGMPKSTADALASACPKSAVRSRDVGRRPQLTSWTPGQLDHYWDCLRGQGPRTAPRYVFSWWNELRELAQGWWWRWR